MQHHYQATLQQGIDFLRQLSPAQYIAVTSAAISPIGSHVRHILDHFNSVQRAAHTRLVDYELRQRGSAIELDLHQAITTMQQLQNWVVQLTASELEKSVLVQADIGIGSSKIVQVPSTMGRELMFCCSHAIHHYSSLKSIYQALGGQSADSFDWHRPPLVFSEVWHVDIKLA